MNLQALTLKIGLKALFIGAFFVLAAKPALGHHVSMRPGFFGYVVVDLALPPWDPQSLYAAAFGRGIFVSSDGGGRWHKLNEGLTDLSVRALAFQTSRDGEGQDGTLYLATDQGVFRRSNGSSWKPLPGLNGRSVRVLRVRGGLSSALFAGTEAGVFVSFDSGRSWEKRSRGLTNLDVRTLALDPKRPGRLYAGTFGGVFRSDDGGRNWRAASKGLADTRVRTLLVDPHKVGHLFAGSALGGVFESLDGGENWRARNKGLADDTSVMSLALDGGPQGALYAGTREGLFRLPPDGETWEYIRIKRMPLSVPVVRIGPDGQVIITSGGDVFESRDGRKNWQKLTPNLPLQAGKVSIGGP